MNLEKSYHYCYLQSLNIIMQNSPNPNTMRCLYKETKESAAIVTNVAIP